jgi:hypothetical protein
MYSTNINGDNNKLLINFRTLIVFPNTLKSGKSLLQLNWLYVLADILVLN